MYAPMFIFIFLFALVLAGCALIGGYMYLGHHQMFK